MSEANLSKGAEIELSIVLPCLNEAATVGTCVSKARGFLEQNGINGEVVVADNGSTDGSQRIAEERFRPDRDRKWC